MSDSSQELSDAQWDVALSGVTSAPWRLSYQFQPIIDLATGVTRGVEALARFADPPVEGPDAWFAAADRRGIAETFEAQAIELALGHHAELPADQFLSVNVSPVALVSDAVLGVLHRHPEPARLVLEITEQTSVRNYPLLNACLAPLRAAGVRIAVDDAGAGHSSLRQIVELEPDIVKIDRPLISGVDRSAPRAAVVEAVALLCARMGALAIAEGVEHADEARALVALGIDSAQGFLFGRPRPLAARVPFERLAARSRD